MAKKKLTTTRNPEFNKYIDNKGYINSSSDITATSTNPNIKLLDYTAPVYKKGRDIIKDAAKNHSIADLTKKDLKIDTKLSETHDCFIFGSPYKPVLDNRQQYSNCGVDSILNILAMAGIKEITDQNKVETAFTKELWKLGIADDRGKLGIFDYQDGGTKPEVYGEVLEYYGLTTETHFGKGDFPTTDILTLANYIRAGGSAIVGVSADLLYYGDEGENIELDHAISVTGVVYATNEPDDTTIPLGFYIHDTGGWMSRYISSEEFLYVTLNDKLEVEGVLQNGFYATIVTTPIKQNTDNINAIGTNVANIIYGNGSNNKIKGLNGDDTLVGSAGNDKIEGGSGNDIIFANGVIKSEEYLSTIKDEKIKTLITNLDYVVDGNADSDLIGRNFLYGGSGNDYLFGGKYNDTMEGGAGKDYLYGGSGIDVLKGGGGDDYIYAEDGNDRIYGGSGDDYISAGDGDDTVIAGSGNDIIIGGKGEDIIECGGGKDTVIFEHGCETDFVKSSGGSVTLEFRGEEDNKINLTDLDIFLEEESKNKASFNVLFADTNEGVLFSDFYNSKTNKSKKVYIKDDVHEDSYRVSVTKSKGSIKVADKNGNNYLISTSKKSNTVTTGYKNDIVYMNEGNNKITYISGEDYYFTNEGNDTFNLSKFDKDSFLSINDCTDIGDQISPSTNDVLNFVNTSSSDLAMFFDITRGGVINNKNLYFINKSEITVTSDYLSGVLNDSETGMVCISKYFSAKNPLTQPVYTGFGCIETIASNGVKLDIDFSIKQITEDVVAWLGETEYLSVSDAIEKGAENINNLIDIYLSNEIQGV